MGCDCDIDGTGDTEDGVEREDLQQRLVAKCKEIGIEAKIKKPLRYCVWVNNVNLEHPARRIGQRWRATRAPWQGPVDGQGSVPCLSLSESSMGLHAINSRGSGGLVTQGWVKV